jgi:2-isopropylmalate synthase
MLYILTCFFFFFFFSSFFLLSFSLVCLTFFITTGVLKNKETYEIMTPESVGLVANNLVLGKHSGRAAYSDRLQALGYKDLSKEQLESLVDRFKRIADDKKTVTDEDIEAIVNDEVFQPSDMWKLGSVHVTAGDKVKPTATVTLVNADGEEFSEASLGKSIWLLLP